VTVVLSCIHGRNAQHSLEVGSVDDHHHHRSMLSLLVNVNVNAIGKSGGNATVNERLKVAAVVVVVADYNE
jgi:hypothetical protein